MTKHKLNAQKIAKAPAGRYCDGGNLWVYKDSPTVGRFVFRYMLHGSNHSLGLGSMAVYSLAEARAEADRLRKILKRGVDPLATKRADATQKKLEAASALTFRTCAERYFEENRAEWRNARHAQQWENSLKQWAFPIIGDIPVQLIDTPLVLRVLQQKVAGVSSFWEVRSETASRVRSRIETVLGWAATRGYRTTESQNPARWSDYLEHVLPRLVKAGKVAHLAALPYSQVPAFAASLRAQTDVASRALEYCILVAARTNEVLGLTWGEVDLGARLIVIPPHRTKSHREHRIAVSSRVLEILGEMRGGGDKPADALVFGPLDHHAMRKVIKRLGYNNNATIHGFRSSFSTWVSETTDYPNEMAELALSHRVGSRVELAYRRGDQLKRRYKLMEDWAAFAGSAHVERRAAAVA